MKKFLYLFMVMLSTPWSFASQTFTGGWDQDIYTQTSTQQYELGTLRQYSDGRKFRYSLAGASNIAAGRLCQTAANVANHIYISALTGSLGSNTVTATLGATLASANQYAEGWLAILDGTGAGQTYRIKSNAAAALSATITLTLYDPLAVAISTDTHIALIANMYNGTIISPTTRTGIITGVTPIAVTAAYYFWQETCGPASVLAENTSTDMTVGENVEASTNTAGAVMDRTTNDTTSVGVSMASSTDAYVVINLRCDEGSKT